jgi:PmbA protein
LAEGAKIMHFNEFKNILFSKAKDYGFENCAIEYQKGNSFQVRIFKGEISEYKNSSYAAIAFRGLINGKMGYAFTEKIQEDIIHDMLENASFNAKIINEKEILFKGDSTYKTYNGYNEQLEKYSVEDKINFAKTMEKEALIIDKRVVSVDHCIFSSGVSETTISNTLGLKLHKKSNVAIVYLGCRVEESGKIKSFGEKFFGNDISKFDPKEIAQKAVEKSLSYLNSESINSGKYEVILKNEVMCMLLGSVVSNFYASSVQKGFSLLKDKIGTKIASDIINIKDDGIFMGNIGNETFDSEGVATKNKVIIENGVLQTYLYNLKTAEKDNVKPTGNGFKQSIKSNIDTSATNFYITPSSTKYLQMVKNMKKGVIITEVKGLHSGINSISCDFSLSADGFFVENGKITKPLEQITIAGNFFDMLKDVIEISNDLKFEYPMGSGTFGSPSIKIKSLDITGT